MNRIVMPNLFSAWGAVIDTEDGARAALRWMTDPALGLPANHFKVWHLPKSSTAPKQVDPSSRRIRSGLNLHTWPGQRAAATVRVILDITAGQVRVRAHSGPSGAGQAVDEEIAIGPATGAVVTLSGASIRSVTTTGNATVTGMAVLDLQQHVDDPNWKLLEHVGLPVDKRFAGEYPLDPQGPVGAMTDPVKAAVIRVGRGTPAGFWPGATDTGEAAPPFDPPDPDALVRGELEPVMEQLAAMLAETGDRSRHAGLVVERALKVPQSVHGTDAPDRWRSGSKAKLPPLRAALLAAGTDPYGALALGFGTSIDGAELMTVPSALTHGLAQAATTSLLLMVTLEHKASFAVKVGDREISVPFDHDLAALVVIGATGPVAPTLLRTNENRDTPRLDRPGGRDLPWLESVEVSWAANRPASASGMGPSTFAVLRSVGGSALEPALDKRPSGGHRVFVPGLAGDTDRARFTSAAVPEQFPGESIDARFSVAAQDWFGRWSGWSSVDHERVTVEPQWPAVRSVEVDEDGPSPEAVVEFTWDWADRSPVAVHLRLRVFRFEHRDDTAPPVDGSVLSPGGAAVADRIISFSGASPDSPPTGVTEVIEERDGDLRTYQCRIPGIALPYATYPRMRVEASARAAERVRPATLGAFSKPVGVAALSPLLPPAPVTTAPMRWASLPDAAGIARAVLDWSGSGPTYTVYVADETAIARELGLPSPNLDRPAAERLQALRGLEFDVARRAFRRHAEQLAEPRLEVALPKGSKLIHFYGVSAVSVTGNERPLPADANRYLAVAAPVRLEPAPPLLAAKVEGAAVRLSASVASARVPVDRIAVVRVDDRAKAVTPEAAGAPILTADAATATARDGKLHWELTDATAPPTWTPVFYRAIATAVADPDLGQIAGHSQPGPAVEIVVPSANPPQVNDLTVISAAGATTVAFATDASRTRTRLGAFTVSVTAVHTAAGTAETTVLREQVADLAIHTGPVPADTPALFLHRATTADPYRVTARLDGTPASVSVEATDPLGRRTSATWSTPVINPILASTAFNATGLEALGHASAQLSAKWADSRPTADESGLSLNLSAPWLAPIDGYLTWSRVGAPALTDHTGAPLSGAVAVLRFHPQGALRLQRLIADRYDGGAHRRPTPFVAAIRGGTPPATTPTGKPGPPDTMRAGDDLGPGRLTFHDDRGLVIDPIAVACMFHDLLEAMPRLHRSGEGTVGDASDGSLAQIAALGEPRVRLHLVDLFGNPWNDHADREGVRLGTGGRLGSGVHDWTEALDVTGPGIRAGLLPDGELATAAIEVPAPPPGTGSPALDREFFRAAVVDLPLHLHGNRAGTAVDSVPGVDATTAAEPAPPLGTGDLTVLTTGQHFLGAAGQIARAAGTRLAASPRIEDDFALPADGTERWPLAPAPLAAAEDLTGEHAARARTDASAAYIGATPDVVVSWPAGALPVEAFVRVFPRVDPGRAIVPLALLNFSTRGDGGAAIVPAGGECRVRVPDPYLVGANPRPTAPGLVFDLLIVTRGPAGGRERLFGSIHLDPIGEGGTDPTPSAAPNAFDAIPDDHRGICPAPVLGLEPTAPPSGFDLVLDAFGAAAPRQSPRFATMARTETLVAGHDGTASGGWTSLIGPGHLTEAFMSGDARRGSPGLPAGPEEHAPAVQATGPLAQHLAGAALRRTHHLVARLVELDNGRWAAATGTAGNATGAVLQTVAPTVESPELKAALQLVDVDTLPDDWAGLMGAVGGLLPPPLDALTSMTPDAGDRWVAEFKREARAANQGRRDAQWAWRWAIAHARRLVYVETTLLSPTAAATEDHKVDLVAALRTRLTAAPDLRVVLVTPRRIPFGTGYESFAQRMHLERQAAVTTLQAAFPERVVAYHPVGFPGRPENLRGTFAVVDDVWALIGGSTFSRRGLTFDGSCDLAFVGHDLKDGVSAAVRGARRTAMARVLGVGPREPGSAATPDPRWTQLNGPRSAFDLMKRTVAAGGEGEVQPRWDGLPTTELPALAKDIADPEGREFSSALTGLAGILAGLGTGRL